MIDIDILAYQIHSNAVGKGFWDENNGVNFYLKQIAMIHSEATECLEAIRKQQGEDQIVLEMADIIIRVLDLYAGMREDGVYSLSLEDKIKEKVAYNATREKMHGTLA
jgi:NTP pyrophosphatase (non-canonical NTP hydrolase)